MVFIFSRNKYDGLLCLGIIWVYRFQKRQIVEKFEIHIEHCDKQATESPLIGIAKLENYQWSYVDTQTKDEV